VQWHPQVFFFFTSDEFVFYVTIFGLYFEIKEKKWSAIWFFVGLFFLFAWPTKWPQYTLILSPVLAIIAGKTLQRGWSWIKPQDDYWNYLEAMLPKPPKITWWIIGIFFFGLFGGKVVYEYQLALARRGWNSYDMTNSPLVSNVINQVNSGRDKEILFATNKGFLIWKGDSESLWGESVTLFDRSNSPIPFDRITSVSYNPNNEIYWLGTENGVVSYDGFGWEIYNQNSVGCEKCLVNDIAIDSSNIVWVGLNDGIYSYDGAIWEKLTDPNSEITDEVINSVVRQKSRGIDKLWIGTYQGVSVYDFLEKSWEHYIWADNFFGWGGVVEVNILKDGRVIANTSGGGIGIFQDEWTFYKNSNSPLKSNTVNTSIQAMDGSIWFGFGYPTEPGGYLMRLDPENEWHRYAANNSGYLESEPLDLFFDEEGRLWIATNGNGIQTFYRQIKNGGSK
jgi:ligand-binding sensor domain-containing protein